MSVWDIPGGKFSGSVYSNVFEIDNQQWSKSLNSAIQWALKSGQFVLLNRLTTAIEVNVQCTRFGDGWLVVNGLWRVFVGFGSVGGFGFHRNNASLFAVLFQHCENLALLVKFIDNEYIHIKLSSCWIR